MSRRSGELSRLSEEVERGAQRFWSRCEIVGFDKDGEPIRTNIPRVRPTSLSDWHNSFGSEEIPRRKLEEYQ